MTAIAYDKGYMFLRMLEEVNGRVTFDNFLKKYFEKHAFQAMDTDNFIDYMNTIFLQLRSLN